MVNKSNVVKIFRYRTETRVALAVSVLACCIGFAQPSTADPREYELKAAFLYRFVAYVEWSTPESDSDDVFTVGVVGDDQVGAALATLEQKNVDGRPIDVVRIHSVADANLKRCHILFISASAERELETAFASLGTANVLTVGETDGFAKRGGMIELRKHKNKVNFAINHEAARSAELHVSARLLDLAEQVY